MAYPFGSSFGSNIHYLSLFINLSGHWILKTRQDFCQPWNSISEQFGQQVTNEISTIRTFCVYNNISIPIGYTTLSITEADLADRALLHGWKRKRLSHVSRAISTSDDDVYWLQSVSTTAWWCIELVEHYQQLWQEANEFCLGTKGNQQHCNFF